MDAEAARASTGDCHEGLVVGCEDTLKYSEQDVTIYKSSIQKANARVGELELKCDRLASALEKEKAKNEELRVALEGYETAMVELTEKSSTSVSVSDFVALEKANEQGAEDLMSVEQSFAELHDRYERLRVVSANQKENEEALIMALNHGKDRIQALEEQYDKLKGHAEDKINNANVKINQVREENEQEVIVLKLAAKKAQDAQRNDAERYAIEKQELVAKHQAELEALKAKNILYEKEKTELDDICEQLMSIHGE